MPLRFDATLKGLAADHPRDFAAAFGLPADDAVTALNIDLSTSAATDVALAFGEPFREIVDLNFQSGPDAALPERLHMYNTVLHARYGISVLSILVLLRKKADAASLTGKLAYGIPGQRVEFEYRTVRLWQLPADNFLHGGLAALPLATLCETPSGKQLPEALRELVSEIDRRLAKEARHAEAVRLMTAAYILTGLRFTKTDLASIYRGVGLMQESTAFDEAMEEGERRGELSRNHKLLLRLGGKQFGAADPATQAELTGISDLDRLDRLADAILTAKSWQELLATP